MPVFLVHSFKSRVFNHSTCVFKFVFDCHVFTCVQSSSNSSGMNFEYVTSLIACYVFTRVCRMHYLSSSNSQYPLGLEITLARVGTYTVSYDKFLLHDV